MLNRYRGNVEVQSPDLSERHTYYILQNERNTMNEERIGLNDFRTIRHRLPPDSFAMVSDEEDFIQKDLIEEEIWDSIVFLSDDVSLRTSDNHGTELKAMHELWASWIESFGEEKDAMWYVMLDVSDEFQACLFNLLCGFYRVAASCLRSALELTTIATYFQLQFDGLSELRKWKEGQLEVKFGNVCDKLHKHSESISLENHLGKQMNYSLFGSKSSDNPKGEGWARKLFSNLSNFAHSRPTHSSGIMWEGSNGPIYVPGSFRRIYALYLDTMALGFVLVKLSRPAFKLPDSARYLFSSSQVKPSKVAINSYRFLWGKP